MRQQSSSRVQDIAREMRRHPTAAEARLWQVLRRHQLGVKFRRQMPLGPYIADFASCAARLIVEVDGDHHQVSGSDPDRDVWLEQQGWHVLRVRNDAVLKELDAVVHSISLVLVERLHDADTIGDDLGSQQTGGPLQTSPASRGGFIDQT